MSEINYQALREAAEKATKGRWAVEFDDEIYSTDGVNHEQIAMVFSENEACDAAFIAAANPATVLALLNEMEAAEKRNERALELLSSADSENVWEIIGRLKVVISGDYRSEAETAAAAGKGE